jgi:hypothetical protein
MERVNIRSLLAYNQYNRLLLDLILGQPALSALFREGGDEE